MNTGNRPPQNDNARSSEPGHALPPSFSVSAGSNFECPGSEHHERPLMDLASALIGLGKVISYYPSLASVFGLKESIFICNFAWWTGKQRDKEGWIYKTISEIEEETALTKEEQMRLRARLVSVGILEEKDDRLHHRKFYRLNFDRINEFWVNRPEKTKPTSRSRENPLGEVGNPDFAEWSKPTSSNNINTSSTLTTNPEPENGHSVPFQCLEIFGAYPRRIGKPKALIAIRKALSKTTFEDLLTKTKAYASARHGEDPNFTPHPSTFYNQERYNDDPATWKRTNFVTPKENPRNFGIPPSNNWELARAKIARDNARSSAQSQLPLPNGMAT